MTSIPTAAGADSSTPKRPLPAEAGGNLVNEVHLKSTDTARLKRQGVEGSEGWEKQSETKPKSRISPAPPAPPRP